MIEKTLKNLIDIYQEKVASGHFHSDFCQENAIILLNKLSLELADYNPQIKKGFFAKKQLLPKGFYFYGGVGRGKSMVMDLFFQHAPVQKKRRVHFHAFMLEVHDFLHDLRSSRTEQDRVDDDLLKCAEHIAKNSTLLCFDEFQVKDVADAMILGRLFTSLFDAGVVVVMTTNILPDDLYMDGLQRDRFMPFIALLKERLNVVHFSGDVDYRLNRIAGMKTYFWPHDADASATLDKIFIELSGGEAGIALDIKIKGRVIHVPKATKEVAFFDFATLCDTSKSALDYLALVQRYKVFIISNVPRLNDNKRDAVLRFITFIDTLYDHKGYVVLSAACLPQELYIEGHHAGAFPRTVSRLLEMQSKDYLQR